MKFLNEMKEWKEWINKSIYQPPLCVHCMYSAREGPQNDGEGEINIKTGGQGARLILEIGSNAPLVL